MAIGTIIILSAIGGILSWVGFNYGLEKPTLNSSVQAAICKMLIQNIYIACIIKLVLVWGASCPDCHVPHEFGAKNET